MRIICAIECLSVWSIRSGLDEMNLILENKMLFAASLMYRQLLTVLKTRYCCDDSVVESNELSFTMAPEAAALVGVFAIFNGMSFC